MKQIIDIECEEQENAQEISNQKSKLSKSIKVLEKDNIIAYMLNS